MSNSTCPHVLLHRWTGRCSTQGRPPIIEAGRVWMGMGGSAANRLFKRKDGPVGVYWPATLICDVDGS
jgi:hypothetical protein